MLLVLRSAAILVLAAERGLISELSCAMPECKCPEGRSHFEKRGGYNYWAPSADRFPLPGRDGGTYVPENVRLAHFQCNRAEGTRQGGLISGPLPLGVAGREKVSDSKRGKPQPWAAANGRDSAEKCKPGCTCGHHNPRPLHAVSHKCPDGCRCRRHSPRDRTKS